MNIGFTYDLRDDYLAEGFSPEDAAEFDKPDTIDGIEAAIVRLGHRVDRIGRLPNLVRRLSAGEKWDLVFNIAEGWRGPTRESQIPALLEAYGVPAAFGDSLCLAVCLHKGHTKHIVRGAGLRTPDFAVVDDPDRDFAALPLAYPVFAKPVAEGTGKGVSSKGKATNPDQLRAVCRDLIAKFRQAAIVEEFLPGREFTVGITGTGRKARILGVMEVLLGNNAEPDAYSFENKDKYEDRVTYRLADDAEAREAGVLALASYRALDCRDGGRVDIRSDADGRPNFIEANPLAGLNPTHSDLPILCRKLGIGYDKLIADIVHSALERV